MDGLKIYAEPDSIAWGIDRLFEDFGTGRQMGIRGRQKVERGFTWEAVADETLKAYREAAPELKPLLLPPELATAAHPSRASVPASARATCALMLLVDRSPAVRQPLEGVMELTPTSLIEAEEMFQR
ncbi:MAG: glycosyltransferase [bacterium]